MSNHKKQKGISLVAVVFLLTVLAVAVIFIQRLLSVSVATNNLALQGARAWQAAQAGSEWGIYQVLNSGCPAASTNLTLTESSLSGFVVTVDCSSTAFTEEGQSVTLYNLDVVAEFGTLGTNPEYASRRISLTVEN